MRSRFTHFNHTLLSTDEVATLSDRICTEVAERFPTDPFLTTQTSSIKVQLTTIATLKGRSRSGAFTAAIEGSDKKRDTLQRVIKSKLDSDMALAYLNEAVYPLFILHLTVIAMLGYFVTPLDLSVAAKYLLITTSTITICLASYHLLIRPFNWMRWLFGVKPKPSHSPATAAARPG